VTFFLQQAALYFLPAAISTAQINDPYLNEVSRIKAFMQI
jgi:hypothetical protein